MSGNGICHSHVRRLALCLAAIVCGLAGTAFVLLDEALHTIILPPPPTLFFLVPLAVVTAATLALPSDAGFPGAWREGVGWLKIAALAALGLAPFLSWQARLPATLYMSLAATAGVAFMAVYLFRLCGLLEWLFVVAGDAAAARWARLTRALMLYCNLSLVIAVGVLTLSEQILYRVQALESLRALWSGTRGAVRAGFLLMGGAILALLLVLLARAVAACVQLPPPTDTPPGGGNGNECKEGSP